VVGTGTRGSWGHPWGQGPGGPGDTRLGWGQGPGGPGDILGDRDWGVLGTLAGGVGPGARGSWGHRWGQGLGGLKDTVQGDWDGTGTAGLGTAKEQGRWARDDAALGEGDTGDRDHGVWGSQGPGKPHGVDGGRTKTAGFCGRRWDHGGQGTLS